MPEDNSNPDDALKRELDASSEELSANKKLKTEDGGGGGDDDDDGLPANANSLLLDVANAKEMAFVPPGTEGVTTINDNDVLSGRGGGTNLHPGNRQFRDLINLYRRDYLKARKNDKPAISRSIVNAIREKNGRFLKKVEKSGLWFEIGDDAAREKTSQALRQRAPEMRKLLLDHEMEGARAQQQQMMMGVPPMMMNMPMNMMMSGPNGNSMPSFNPAMMGMGANGQMQMFNPALMGMPMNFNGMPQFDANGNPIMQQQGMNMDQNQQQQQQQQQQDPSQQQQQNNNNNNQNQDGNNQMQQLQQQLQDQSQNQQLQQQNNQNQQQQQQPQDQQQQQQQNPNDQNNNMVAAAAQMMGMPNPMNGMNGMSNPMGGPENNQAPVQATM